MNVKKAPLIIALLFLSVGFSQQLKTNEVVTERHDNGLKKLLIVFEGTGINEALVGKYGFYEDGLNEFIELYRNNKKHGKSLYWHDNGNQKGELNYRMESCMVLKKNGVATGNYILLVRIKMVRKTV